MAADLYKQAGVDVEKGYEAVERMKKHIQRTNKKEVLGGIGAFAGLFDLSGFSYKEPVLVSGTDGVGTKLKLAFAMNRHHTVGIDLVAMCINDIVAQGAKPLFFLDYIACGKNNPTQIEQIVTGVAEGCVQADVALIGGETAEMPGMYQAGEYDLAGFTVGIAEKKELITGESIRAGDVVIGLPSSGIHSNGYSLVRQITADLSLDQSYGLSQTLGEALLTPTRIYAKPMQSLIETGYIKGAAHITGGSFYENLPRMLPEKLGVEIHTQTWEVPEIFPFLQQQGNISMKEMFGVFNMGIGMAFVVCKQHVSQIMERLTTEGENVSIIGSVVEQEGVHIRL
ncbi:MULTISPECIES: phosphoribosylformylglycinamidine cyclo-ligase [Clostridia]|uniref:phosphoribosylformylglycinamidine cyclo-ligase n=1 Tax=Clostridia TaxID=186801 RepID=UPI000EA27410|nr:MULTISPECIES: phosphoribosylformylglycinamidine cyclo-ligase [Clostridia]NBJ69365.1 phosphoribosylformylglycinamidine cyclo-ligase [Roseburia sp. 1XD42-34]RKI79031.1 phosphoribosylformylglycinamidine cyclo-ligase [Clostridium sp. 1xD42-85]